MKLFANRYTFLGFIYLMCMMIFAYKATHSFFTAAAGSTENVFTAAAQFSVPIANTLVINEVMPSADCGTSNHPNLISWIELWNGTNSTVNLKNFKISDGTNITDLVTANSANIASHQFALIAKDTSIFSGNSPCFSSNGAQTFNLGNTTPVTLNTGTLQLFASDSATIIDMVKFNGTFDGVSLDPSAGQSIERVPLGHDSALGGNFKGTDFIVKEVPTAGYGTSLLINEFLAHVGSIFGNEWVELYNPGPNSIDLTGWSLVDGSNTAKILTTLGTINSNSFVVYNGTTGWLNDTGDTISLKDSVGKIIDQHIYGIIAADKTIGRASDAANLWVQPCAISSKGISNTGKCQ